MVHQQPSAKILVAEDDRITRAVIREVLDKEGYAVLEAGNGGLAVQMAAEERPDLILLDVMMPVMNAFEVLEKLGANPVTAPIPTVLLTSVPANQGEEVGLKLGARHYLDKPVDPAAVKAVVRITLREAMASSPGPSESDDTLSLGNQDMDQSAGGGVSRGSLVMVDGEPSTGKSVLCQQISFAALGKGDSVGYFTVDDSQDSLMIQMASLGLDTAPYRGSGAFNIVPIKASGPMDEAERTLSVLFNQMEGLSATCKAILVDPVTSLAGLNNGRALVPFFHACRTLGRFGATTFLAVRSSPDTEKLVAGLAAMCDFQLHLGDRTIGGKSWKTLDIYRNTGGTPAAAKKLNFEVIPGLGTKTFPVSEVSF